MLDAQHIQTIRTTILSFFKEHDISIRVTPFDNNFYRECIDEAVQRGYPIDGDQSLQRYLPDGAKYISIVARHYTHRPTQVWMALYVSSAFYVDDVPSRYPSEIPHIYMFHDRFMKNLKQGNPALDAFADLVRRAPDLFESVIANLIVTSSLDFVTAAVMDHGMASMPISSAAQQYPVYQRNLSGLAETFAFMAFPPEIPLTEYLQVIPEVMQFMNDLNDVLSFYKEELDGETTNQVSIMAARNNESKMETLKRMAKSAADLHKTIVMILGGSSDAYQAFRKFFVGFCEFHFAIERYQLADLDLLRDAISFDVDSQPGIGDYVRRFSYGLVRLLLSVGY